MKTYIEIEVDVDFDYTPAYKGSRWEPPEDAVVDITAVKLGKADILHVLPDDTINSLIDACYDEVAYQQEIAMEARAEVLYEERAMNHGLY